MTEKRFIALDEGYDLIVRDIITHNDLCDVESIIDVLNDYEKENEELKKQKEHLERKIERERIATHKQYEKWEKEALEKISKLEKENEQLKQRNKTLQKSINDFIKVEEENEQLKANCKNYEWYKQYKELLNENEQLKQTIQSERRELISENNEYRNKAYDLEKENEQLEVLNKLKKVLEE